MARPVLRTQYLAELGRSGTARLYGINPRKIDTYMRPGSPKFTADELERIAYVNTQGQLIRNLIRLGNASRNKGEFRAPIGMTRLPFRSALGTLIATVVTWGHSKQRAQARHGHKALPPKRTPAREKRRVISAIRALGGDPIGHYYHSPTTK